MKSLIPLLHADLHFVEIISTHFLDLITSPRNPMQYTSLERTAASFSTVVILNNLFFSSNDIIDLAWFERVALMTEKKEKDDEVKIAIKTIEVLNFTKAMSAMNYSIPQSHVRFFGVCPS
ncbi:hypothetical protein AB4K20DRAFT_1524894 [Rhizopus microsporus]